MTLKYNQDEQGISMIIRDLDRELQITNIGIQMVSN